MPSRRKIKIEKVSDSNVLQVNTRRLSIQIKRLTKTEVTENMKLADPSLVEVKKWQQDICDHLKELNQLGVLEESDRVFNMKEAFFLLNPACTDSPFFTTLIVIEASGIMAPAKIFFPNNELPPQNIFIDKTSAANNELPKDYPTDDKLLNYMQLTFLPWLISKQKSFPVIIFIEIDPVHISWQFLAFCKENQILLMRSTPALSLHPISSFVLPHLKNAWTTTLLEWTNKNENQQIAFESVPLILRQVFENTITVDLLKNAFGKCGTFPFDPVIGYKQGLANHIPLQKFDSTRQPDQTQAITQSSGMDLSHPTIEMSQQEVTMEDESLNDETLIQENIVHVPEQTVHPAPQRTQKAHTVQSTTAQLQAILGPLTYEFINAGSSWSGSIENTSLFYVWQHLLQSHQDMIYPIPQAAHTRALGINDQFRMRFEGLIGPLLHEFKKSGNVWTGATENRGLFDVWKEFISK